MAKGNGLTVNYEYIHSTAGDVRSAASDIVGRYAGGVTPLRMVFFGSPTDNADYSAGLAAIRRAVAERWGERAPMVTYVAQPPLGGSTLVAEVHTADGADKTEYKSYGGVHYIVISGPWGRKVVTGGIQGGDLDADMRSQSDEVFEVVDGILKAEDMVPGNIVRQWNYLERITDFDGQQQRYQAFNDSRSEFYAADKWLTGYPAATGIGTQHGGVTVEFDAVASTSGVGIFGVDNSLQVAAHDYSKQVLLGEGVRSTPKFERAKALTYGDSGMVYISGTAAIRGEESLTDSGIAEQTRATLENIDFLTGEKNLSDHGVGTVAPGRYGCFRVYLKNPESLDEAREVIGRTHGEVPALYVWSDVCRCELLIEIEGVKTINY